MKLPDKVYDVLKWIVLIVIPATVTFYSVLDKVFKWGYADLVAEIAAGACAFLGAILGFSTAEYNKNKGVRL